MGPVTYTFTLILVNVHRLVNHAYCTVMGIIVPSFNASLHFVLVACRLFVTSQMVPQVTWSPSVINKHYGGSVIYTGQISNN
jgi:hypothetical protein